jgi:hypothetical protein
MKDFLTFLNEGVSNFEIGQTVMFNVPNVSKYVDLSVTGGADYGLIVSKMNGMYELKLDNNNVIKIKGDDITGLGSSEVVSGD